MTSASFDSLRVRCGDIAAVDALYLMALECTDNDIGRALFLCMTAVFEHRTVDLKMPVVHSIPLPLTFESKSVFLERKQHIPKKIYKDTPPTIDGDRDKLQHFFSAAYLTYRIDAPAAAGAIGGAVEWAEPILVVGGEDDPRDRRANDQGILFGRDLKTSPELLPSDYLTLQFQDRK